MPYNALRMKKNDPVLGFKSDCLTNAPPIFCTQLSLLFRQFLIHGHISSFLMISTLIPLVKEKMGDITSSDNYRSIAISSLILKVFDYFILDIHGDSLTAIANCNLDTRMKYQQVCVRGWW